MPSYQSLWFLSSSPQPSASSLATTLTRVQSAISSYDRYGERRTPRVSWSVPLPFLPVDYCVVSFPKQSSDQHTTAVSVVSPQSHYRRE